MFMVIPVVSATYTHPHPHNAYTVGIDSEFADWQGDIVGKVKYLQIFTGTGLRVQLDHGPEHWVHWGRIMEWSEPKK